jgi:tRNA-dihydrouridine synthase A
MASITRHMLALYQAVPGARAWRRLLSERAPKVGTAQSQAIEVMRAALACVEPDRAAA